MDAIVLKGVRTHNLKNFDLILPHKKFYIVTGVSGSGKSSLAFDTLYAEGQRRYVESLSSYARQFLERMEKPEIEGITGIPPAIAIEAKNVITNARSTVGTQTEINDYLRVFFARVGKTHCLKCNHRIEKQTPQKVAEVLFRKWGGKKIAVLFPIRLGKKGGAHFKTFLPELGRQGFTEVVEEGGRIPLLEFKPGKDTQEIWIVADRLTSERKEQKRLIDSMELAFQLGKGEIGVFKEDEKKEQLFFSEHFRCDQCKIDYREPAPNLFSFNSPLGACSTCQGFGRVITIDWDRVIPDQRKTIEEGAIEPWTKPSAHWELRQLLSFCRRQKIPLKTPWQDLGPKHQKLILEGTGNEKEFFSVQDFFSYLETKTYKMHVRIFLSRYRRFVLCPTCQGARLKPEALAVRVAGKNMAELSSFPIRQLFSFFEELCLDPEDEKKVEPVLLEIKKRLRFLKEVGLTYLTLDRLSRTLSGGEVERIHLATSLGSGLVDTLYVLDEPSIGLHERDNELLIRLLKELRDLGNTVVVVEHDRAMIEAADEVLDLGPFGGEKGGEMIFQGKVQDLVCDPRSLTGSYLAGKLEIGWKKRKTKTPLPLKETIRIQKAKEHNLHSVDLEIPLGQFVVVTGVSGSGKSTLIYDVLYQNYQRWRGRPVQDLGEVKAIEGFEQIDEMVLIDQTPIGRTPRSNPVTYLKAFDDIRRVFGSSEAARRAGFNFRHFSFNIEGGRCEECKGGGRIKVEMHFLADVFIPCEACRGKRFKPEVLEIRYLGKNIDDVLQMTVDETIQFFKDRPGIREKLGMLQKVGLGYLRLGQPAPTLSGGEAQRLKLACEMGSRATERLLYLFDEPTTGLHYHDISYLMEAFEELLNRGHSLLVIEHNMEVIQCADWVIDLGPEGGEGGGNVVYHGPLAGLMETPQSHTGRYLRRHFDKKVVSGIRH